MHVIYSTDDLYENLEPTPQLNLSHIPVTVAVVTINKSLGQPSATLQTRRVHFHLPSTVINGGCVCMCVHVCVCVFGYVAVFRCQMFDLKGYASLSKILETKSQHTIEQIKYNHSSVR